MAWMDSLILPWVSAETMSIFLAEVARRHANEFILMVMDRAGWHLAGKLIVPENMRLMFLPLQPGTQPRRTLVGRLCVKTVSPTMSSKTSMPSSRRCSTASSPWKTTHSESSP